MVDGELWREARCAAAYEITCWATFVWIEREMACKVHAVKERAASCETMCIYISDLTSQIIPITLGSKKYSGFLGLNRLAYGFEPLPRTY